MVFDDLDPPSASTDNSVTKTHESHDARLERAVRSEVQAQHDRATIHDLKVKLEAINADQKRLEEQIRNKRTTDNRRTFTDIAKTLTEKKVSRAWGLFVEGSN
jgi:hypothetical protein